MTQPTTEMKDEINYSSKGEQRRKLPGFQDSPFETQQVIKTCLTMAERNAGKRRGSAQIQPN